MKKNCGIEGVSKHSPDHARHLGLIALAISIEWAFTNHEPHQIH